MLECAFCNSQIDADSWFCDQCGKEIMLCETCRQPGRGQWCEEDGGSLIAARSFPGASIPATTPSAASIPPVSTQEAATTASSPLKLINSNLGISIDIQPGTILGRTSGPYVASVGSLSAISGKHLMFNYHPVQGWTFTDLGSSNGTKYSKTNNAWQQTARTAVNEPVILENKTYLLVANIEFAVQMQNDSSSSTQRI